MSLAATHGFGHQSLYHTAGFVPLASFSRPGFGFKANSVGGGGLKSYQYWGSTFLVLLGCNLSETYLRMILERLFGLHAT